MPFPYYYSLMPSCLVYCSTHLKSHIEANLLSITNDLQTDNSCKATQMLQSCTGLIKARRFLRLRFLSVTFLRVDGSIVNKRVLIMSATLNEML